MDISKVQFLNEKQLGFLADNSKALVDKSLLKMLKHDNDKAVKAHKKRVSIFSLVATWSHDPFTDFRVARYFR